MRYKTFLSQYFHQLSSNRPPFPDPGDPIRARQWEKTLHKSYPRLPQILLPRQSGAIPNISLRSALRGRMSVRNFSPKPVDLVTLGRTLYHAAGVRSGNHTRQYPSAGARFPLETYALVLRAGDGLPAGLYHYSVVNNSLELLGDDKYAEKKRIQCLFAREWSLKAPIFLFVTAQFWRTQMKYGERGYRYILIEAGHLGQNIYLVAHALGLGCCAIGGYVDQQVNQFLDIDGVSEAAVYSFALGWPKR